MTTVKSKTKDYVTAIAGNYTTNEVTQKATYCMNTEAFNSTDWVSVVALKQASNCQAIGKRLSLCTSQNMAHRAGAYLQCQ